MMSSLKKLGVIHIRISPEEDERWKIVAQHEYTSVSDFVRRTINKHINKRARTNKRIRRDLSQIHKKHNDA